MADKRTNTAAMNKAAPNSKRWEIRCSSGRRIVVYGARGWANRMARKLARMDPDRQSYVVVGVRQIQGPAGIPVDSSRQ